MAVGTAAGVVVVTERAAGKAGGLEAGAAVADGAVAGVVVGVTVVVVVVVGVAAGMIPVVESAAGDGVVVVVGAVGDTLSVTLPSPVGDVSVGVLSWTSRLFPSGSNKPPLGTPNGSRFCANSSTTSGSFIKPLLA